MGCISVSTKWSNLVSALGIFPIYESTKVVCGLGISYLLLINSSVLLFKLGLLLFSNILFNSGASYGIYVALSTIWNDLLLWEHAEVLKKIGLDKEVEQLFDCNDKIVTDEELEKKKKEQERLKALEKKFSD